MGVKVFSILRDGTNFPSYSELYLNMLAKYLLSHGNVTDSQQRAKFCLVHFFFCNISLGWGMLSCKHKIQQNGFCILWLQLHLKENAQLVSCCSFAFSSGFLTTYPSEGPALSSTTIELH